jgi:hypothetical protein
VALEMAAVTLMLQARNLEETIVFHTKTPEFTVDNLMENWRTLSWSESRVMFYPGLEHTPAEPAMTGVLYFNPKDVRARALGDVLKGKAPVDWDLQVMEYGMLEFAFRDCNGYILSPGREIAKAA